MTTCDFSGIGRLEIYVDNELAADKIRVSPKGDYIYECFTEGPSFGVFTPVAKSDVASPLWVIEIPPSLVESLPETAGHSLHSWAVHVAASMLYGLFIVTPNDHEAFLAAVHKSVFRLFSDKIHQSWVDLFMERVQGEVDGSFEH